MGKIITPLTITVNKKAAVFLYMPKNFSNFLYKEKVEMAIIDAHNIGPRNRCAIKTVAPTIVKVNNRLMNSR
jgi:hypothetical protein